MNKKVLLLLVVVFASVFLYLNNCNKGPQCAYRNFSDATSLGDSLNIYALNFDELFRCIGSVEGNSLVEVSVKDLPPIAMKDPPACPPPMCRSYLEKVGITRNENDTMIIYNNYKMLGENVIVCTTEAVNGNQVVGYYKFKLPASPVEFSNPIKIEFKRAGKEVQSIYINIK